MDISTLTQSEVEELIRQLSTRHAEIRAEALAAQNARTGRIEESIAELDALLGPVGAVPGVDSIRAVRGHDGQTMADNAAVALPLVFQGLEILAATTRDIANTIANAE